jgi:glutamate-1-semialdehyde 2,1-aminomutase
MSNERYTNSTEFLARAEISIPLGSQTFSKSRTQYPVGVSPLFIAKAKGAQVWDIDGNKYIDLVNSLAAVTLGYRDKTVDRAVRKQLRKGSIFSLPGILESEVAELIIETVPSAEQVRFAKNGSDATSAAIRLSRAYTGRQEVAFCGYHGWSDWYIGATTLNKGVPDAVSRLTHKFEYNNIGSLQRIFDQRGKNIAAIILEPMNTSFPKDNFLQRVKEIAVNYGAILIFDETITGYRFKTGGAQQEFGVLPDLTTLGKGIANGFPLSAITGKKELMQEMQNVFISGTFGGELISLAAAKAVIQLHIESDISSELAKKGDQIAQSIEKMIIEYKLTSFLEMTGHPTWKFLNWKANDIYPVNVLKTFFMQEIFKQGVLVLSSHNVSLALSDQKIKKVLEAYRKVLEIMGRNIEDLSLLESLKVEPIQPLFKVR